MPPDFAQRYPRLAEMIGIDLRSLALLRIGLALVLLCSLLQALGDAGTFYSDAGILPRAALIESGEHWRLSLYLLNGQRGFVVLMLLVQIVCALMLTLGLRTRAASILSFMLWASLLNRNPMVLAHGDALIGLLLFWLMWLPAGARYAVDAALARNAPPAENLHASWASLGLLLQIASVYLFAAILQSDRAWLGGFSALHELMMLDRLTLAPGRWLLQMPALSAFLSGAIHVLEWLGPILLFTPYLLRPLRLASLLLLALLQIGALLCLALGTLPWASLVALSAFIGGWLWDALAPRQPAAGAAPLRLYYDGDCDFCRKSVRVIREFLLLPQLRLAAAQDAPRARTLMQANNSWVLIDTDEQAYLKWQVMAALCRHSPLWRVLAPLLRLRQLQAAGDALYDFVARHRDGLARVATPLLTEREIRWQLPELRLRIAGVLAGLTLIWNLQSAGLLPAFTQRALAPFLQMLRLDQRWDLFAPAPSRDDGWWVIAARRGDGSELDLRHAQRPAPDYSKPPHIVDEAPNSRWRNLDARLADTDASADRQAYAAYLCRRWNAGRQGAQRIMTFKLIYMLERTPPPGEKAQIEQQVALRWECFPEETKGQVP